MIFCTINYKHDSKKKFCTPPTSSTSPPSLLPFHHLHTHNPHSQTHTMKYALFALPAIVAGFVVPFPLVTDAPETALAKRGGTEEKQLTDSVWYSVSSGITEAVTPTYIDGVTVSASPVTASQMAIWASLDGSGIPYIVTPTASDGTTVSSSPVPTATDYPTPDGVPPVLRCYGDRVPDEDSQSYPFCTGVNGTEMVTGETYWLTWDPTYFDPTVITKVTISLVAYPQTGNDSDDLFTSDYVSNLNGYYPLNIQSHYIRSGNGYFYIVITPLVTSQSTATNVSPKTGPLVRAIISESEAQTDITKVPSDNNLDTASSSSSSSSKSNAKVIAPAVVVPVIAVIAIAAFVVYYLNKQKKKSAAASPSNDAAGDSHGNGDIHLSRTTTKDNASIITEETGHNPFQETSRTVL